ncbi:MAG: protein kinase [Gemmatimonadota bacterium]|nr:protein kinase [Gemmatimonadota bacterium]
MDDLLKRLQAALGEGFTVERELGGGGMSRVFLAQDVSLHRRVVVKVLPPELGVGVSGERFQREVRLAAALQHPHIVPVLFAGASGDLRYYAMPYVEGESLRARLSRQRELPVADVVHLLRDVLDGLAAAHAQGVVHRDIKPDNVLLSGRHAVITDFGVSKAVEASTGGTSLTSLGIALGTPAYMAPEQAAADPHIDHRADIYAVGALAYEMLCGRTPFVTATPQQMLSAHLTQEPEPCIAHRAAVPEGLNALVMRCLEKKPADRPQSAEALLSELAPLAASTAGMTPQPREISTGTLAAIARHHPVRLALLSALTPLAVLAAVWGLVRLVGLPWWVLTSALAILLVGAPVLYLTGRAERRRLIAKAQGTGDFSGLARHLSWRRALWGGAGALAMLGVATGAYMAMRQYGVGPFGTLASKGQYEERQPILVIDFENRTSDSTLASTITELVRLDLEQSPFVALLQPAAVRDALRRMQRPATTLLSLDVGRELARREAVTVMLTGDVLSVGGAIVVSARLIDTETGAVLAARKETASQENGITDAVDRLSAGLRERLGETFRSIQSEPSIAAVTTSSFPALRAYMQGTRVYGAGDRRRGMELLRQAINFDSTFAEPHRRLAWWFTNLGFPRDSTVRAATRAYALRGRVPAIERGMIEATYFSLVTEEWERAIAAYEGVLAEAPDHAVAQGNLGLLYADLHRYDAAEKLRLRQCTRATKATPYGCAALANLQYLRGDFTAADRTFARLVTLNPRSTDLPNLQMVRAIAKQDIDGLFTMMDSTIAAWRAAGTADLRGDAEWWAANKAWMQGRLREGNAAREAWAAIRRKANPNWWPEALARAYWAVQDDHWFERDTRRSHAALVAAIPSAALDKRPPADRGYGDLALYFARVGDTTRAIEYMQRYDAEAVSLGPKTRERRLLLIRAYLAMAKKDYPTGIALMREWNESAGSPMNAIWVALAYREAGQADSAVAHFERFLTSASRVPIGYLSGIPRAWRHLGEYAEARGDRATAKRYYEKLLKLWANGS